MRVFAILLCILSVEVIYSAAIPCDSCGNECASACGTKHFRICCFNYLRKRNDPNSMKPMTSRHLIDYIMLQMRNMYSQNGRHQRQYCVLGNDSILKHLYRYWYYSTSYPPLMPPLDNTYYDSVI